MMKINVFDVGHGGCSVVTCPNGARIMIDCAYGLDALWFPSIAFCGQRIDLLAFANLDEDHVRDLPTVCQNVSLGSIFSNPTVTASALEWLKREHEMGNGVRHAHTILRQFGSGLIGTPADIGDVRAWAYWNKFGIDFVETNNLSLAIFVRLGAFTILFAGDLETAGWKTLLKVPGFAADLMSVNVFVTSHHGRESGCCDEVFHVCRPHVFIVSDDERQFESQDTGDWYRYRANGIPDFRVAAHPFLGFPQRYMLTTRRDGNLSMLAAPSGHFRIFPESPPLRRSVSLKMNEIFAA